MKIVFFSLMLVSASAAVAKPITVQCVDIDIETERAIVKAGTGDRDDGPLKRTTYKNGPSFLKATFDDERMNADVQLFGEAVRKMGLGKSKTLLLGTLSVDKVDMRMWSDKDKKNPAKRMHWEVDHTFQVGKSKRNFNLWMYGADRLKADVITKNYLTINEVPSYDHDKSQRYVMLCTVVKNKTLDEWSVE